MENYKHFLGASDKQQKIQHFYNGIEPSKPGGGVALIVIGAIATITGVGLLVGLEFEKMPGGFTLFFGLLFLILGIVVVASRAAARKKFWAYMPTKGQLDGWLKDDIGCLQGEARVKLGIEESELAADPIFFRNPLLPGFEWSLLDPRIDRSFFASRLRPEIGINLPYPSSHELEYVFLTDDIIHIYKTCWSQLYNRKSFEETEEYYLKDVLSVSTEILPLKPEFVLKTIVLKLPGAEVRLSTEETKGSIQIGDTFIPTTPMDKALAAIKTLVKSAKT